MPERENIFSWRGELRGKSAQERSDFYYQRVTDEFKERVMEAEIARQNVDDVRIRELTDNCASEERQAFLNRKLEQRESRRIDVSEGRKNIDLGLAGFFRIDHVHSNSMAKRTEEPERTEHLAHALHMPERHKTVERTTQSVNLSIHGGVMYWSLEVAQDRANTYLIAGETEEAKTILGEAIEEANRLISPEETGILSARGVLKARLANLEKNLGLLIDGFNDVKKAQRREHNPHRLATLSLWLLDGARNFPASWQERLVAGVKGSLGYAEALALDTASSIRAYTQKVKESAIKVKTIIISVIPAKA